MKTKILTLGLFCLFIFAYCNSPADPEIEKTLNPGNPGLPVIASFTATHLQSNHFTLSWSTENATTVKIDQGIGEVPAIGTMEVQILEPTTYTLTASNAMGTSTASCPVEGIPASLMEVEITTIPETVIFTYYPDSDISKATFTVIITETNGEVGGSFSGEIRSFVYGRFGCWTLHLLDWRTIEPLGSVSYDCDIEVLCRTEKVQVCIDGLDTMGREIQKLVDIYFIWAN